MELVRIICTVEMNLRGGKRSSVGRDMAICSSIGVHFFMAISFHFCLHLYMFGEKGGCITR